MDYLILALLAFSGGGLCMFVALDKRRRHLAAERLSLEEGGQQVKQAAAEVMAAENRLNDERTKLGEASRELKSRVAEFQAAAVSYRELQDENRLLKGDLKNLHIAVRKAQLDHQSQQQGQISLDERCTELGKRYLRENVKWISNSLNPNNFANCKQRLLDVIERCREVGLNIPKQEEDELVSQLKAEFEKVVKAAFEREEQARIKAQIREEQQRQKEVDRELARLEREREAIAIALERALAGAKEAHSEEVGRLQQRLAEAEQMKRAVAQAQLTKAGHVYVISNIGSFGEGVFKIGMTRRLEPLQRIRELGDASVPFPFDVHMMISCDDAPALENTLHRTLVKQQLNKTNPRKEFFRADIETISRIVRDNHGEVSYLADPEALEYRQSLTMSDEDLEFIETVYDEVEDELGEPVAEL